MPFFIFCNKKPSFRKTIINELFYGRYKMGKNKKIVFLITLIMVIFLLCSCKYDKVDEKENKSVNIEGRDKESLEILDRSENIADLVVNLIGIENATVIVFQDAALIGIRFYEENDSGLTKDIKDSIEKLVLENDKNINRVLISEDDKTFNEIEEIIQGLLREEHIKNYTNQLNKMYQRMNTQ